MAHRTGPRVEAIAAPAKCGVGGAFGGQCSVDEGQRDGLTTEERFAMANWDVIATGAPALTDAVAVFDCELVDTKDFATHRVLFGKVTGLRIGDKLRPLIYHDRGYHVLTARDGDEALRICAEVAVDLVLTDVVMPGISGHALAERLRARRPTRVLFMSGYDPERAPAGDLLRKPFRPNELATRVLLVSAHDEAEIVSKRKAVKKEA